MKKTLILICILFVANLTFAQRPKLSTTSKKAITYFEKGNEYFDTKRIADAIGAFEEAVKIDSNFLEAHTFLGDLYLDMNKPEKAIPQYLSAIRINPDYFPQTYYNLGKAEMQTDRFEEAKGHFEKAMSYSTLPPVMVAKVKKLILNSTFAAEAKKNPLPFKPINLGDSINTKAPEYCPAITADEKTCYYTVLGPNPRYRAGSNGFGVPRYQEDIYSSENKNGKWNKGKSISDLVNTADNEGALCISADGQTLYYTVCNRVDDYGSCDIYVVRKNGDAWGNPVNIGAPINSEKFESQPSLSADGMTLYFTSNRAGGFGKADIWKSTKLENGEWGAPVNLGPKINTPESEQSPFIHADGKTLYFTSSGLTGMGEDDFFLSRMDNNGEWTTARNLGYPINSIASERSLVINAMGTKGYFASERLGGFGEYDLFYFELPKEIKPLKVSYVKGKIYDSESKKEVHAKLELIDLKTSKVVAVAYSDKVNGDFLICLPTDKDYALNVSRPGYLFYSENFSLKANTNIKEAMLMDVPLKTIKVGRAVVLKNIFFNTNSYELKEESKAELGKVVSFLTTNPNVKIEIGGHTDDVGNDQSNQILSAKRALAVQDYLIAAGIAKERLSSKGYGETKPIATNATEEGKALNRRTEFVVTGI
jgi:outer membrane protein OmpA-like peptidoglycan-associated protein/Tol biopolymer transport system component